MITLALTAVTTAKIVTAAKIATAIGALLISMDPFVPKKKDKKHD